MFRSILSFAVLFAVSNLSGKADAQQCSRWASMKCKATATTINQGLGLSLDFGVPGTELVYNQAADFVNGNCGTNCLSAMELESMCTKLVAYKCTLIGDLTSYPNPGPCAAFEEVPDGDCACGHKTVCASSATKIALRFADVAGIEIGIGADGKPTIGLSDEERGDWQELYDESKVLIQNCWGCLALFLKKSVCEGLDKVATGLGLDLPVECSAL